MDTKFSEYLQAEIAGLKRDALYKYERIIESQQQANVKVANDNLINLCANNYLGLANNPQIIEAGKAGLEDYGYGMASVRFISGTQSPHIQLEKKIADFLGKEDSILYSSCFDANTGLFETLFGPEDAIISDALNHASIIDGIRLCKAARYRYANNDMADLKKQLIEAKNARFKLIATDGVFSMDGIIANLPDIYELAKEHDAMIMVDDSHAVGFMGESGRGTPEYYGLQGKIDIITGTLGKALGGASGGYTAASSEIVEWLRQRSRPYLFSNALAPTIACGSIAVLDFLQSNSALREKLNHNTEYFRKHMEELGFNLVPGSHPIIPVILGEASLAKKMAELLEKEGIYVAGFSFPVVPKGKDRIRTQMSAAHERSHLDKALEAFAKVGRQLNIIS